MLSVKFSEKAILELQTFIRYYEASFLKLYEDSGLWNEHLIREIYIQSSQELEVTIRNAIFQKMSENKILGRKEYVSMSEIDFYVGSRLVVVLFSDDKESRMRWVESISIDRKPIIF